jgi:hypothetical protein
MISNSAWTFGFGWRKVDPPIFSAAAAMSLCAAMKLWTCSFATDEPPHEAQ